MQSRDSSASSMGSLPPYAWSAVPFEQEVGSFPGSTFSGTHNAEPKIPLGYDGAIAHEHRMPSNSLASIQGSDGSIMDPYILVPHISITPEVKTWDDGHTVV